MADILQIEADASRLRLSIRLGVDAEVRILCALAFFSRYADAVASRLEPYVREFVSSVVIAAKMSAASRFLPDDVHQLNQLMSIFSRFQPDIVSVEDVASIARLHRSVEQFLHSIEIPESHLIGVGDSTILCLFVEYPDPALGLPPRGRILNLSTVVSPGQRGQIDDAITIHNPVKQIDDSFLEQASISVAVARDYLVHNHQLSDRKRYRVDFTVDATTSQFTGDSLGVAFAVGSAVAISQLETLRRRISVAPHAAFTGALCENGAITMIDGEGVRLKLQRAFFSKLNAVAVPNAHIVSAVKQTQDLKEGAPARQLHVVGASRFDDLMSNRLLIDQAARPLWRYVGLRAWRARRSPWVEVPVFTALIALLVFLLWGSRDAVPVSVGYSVDGFGVYNQSGHLLWKKTFPGAQIRVPYGALGDLYKITDLDGDDTSEVLLFLPTDVPGGVNARLYVYNARGDSLFSRFCGIAQEYPTDTVPESKPDCYVSGRVQVATVNGQKRILTEVAKNEPGRGYIRVWDIKGNKVGWYINSGGTSIQQVADVDQDGQDELICFGFNNRLGSVAMFVLPADSAFGVGPPYDTNARGYDLSHVRRGNHLVYFAFPPTDVWQFMGRQAYQGSMRIEVNADEIVAAPAEGLDDARVPLYVRYHIGRDFVVKSVSLDDGFRLLRARMVARNQVADVSESTYCKQLQDKVVRYVP